MPTLSRLFRPLSTQDDGTPSGPYWNGNAEEAVLWNPNTGKVAAHVLHDGYGKYQIAVIVSPLKALRLIRENVGSLRSLVAFPRVHVAVSQQGSMEEAQRIAGMFA